MVILGGELAIPFLGLSGRVQFKEYDAVCSKYRAVCTHIVRKARLRGVNFVLPTDVVVSEDPIPQEKMTKCFEKFDSDSRDEGADFDSDIKNVFVGFPPDNAADQEATLLGPILDGPRRDPCNIAVPGFVYDIGEASRKTMQQYLGQCEMLVVWGTAGVCEVSGFQMGQRTLVQASALPNPPEAKPGQLTYADTTGRPIHTWVIGDSAAEWYARICDSDGELGGDLVSAGRLSYVTRNSVFACGMIGNYPTTAFDSILRRPSTELEWSLNHRVAPPLDDEDDEDVEEEEPEEEEDD